ncbi:MlaD family protein [Pedobacter nyackensis]|uniref:Phospholipid/cholesterol/gamma-HCH transport system substrate-binding protein n=1 Tax=Pedobacter nyackensis TaxID=475255 RepID=A0A1W2DCM8_9SPHI|nr:MlaD family protein [Pedobacter nyackensis]SMC94856.1 phospholipid/cholesterol/gamma-HCH transport system substrate-binding protein [Pedobacter nyackensis]
MGNYAENNMRLGIFVLVGLIVLIFAFYMVGKNKSIFGGNFELKARFSNSNGLMKGSNVLYSGIQAGTVKSLKLINDTTIEATLLIDNEVKSFIRKNAIVTIGTEGLMGNKVIQITPFKGNSPLVKEGDLLESKKVASIDEMLQTLSRTNDNIAGISDGLRQTVVEINKSTLWKLLGDKAAANGIESTINQMHQASINANAFSKDLEMILSETKSGKGTAGLLLTDTAFATQLRMALVGIKSAGDHANELTLQLNQMASDLKKDLDNSNGFLNFLVKDSLMIKKLNATMDNIEKGTDGFNQNMEALKHNFLFRGYFKKLEKEKEKRKTIDQSLRIDK